MERFVGLRRWVFHPKDKMRDRGSSEVCERSNLRGCGVRGTLLAKIIKCAIIVFLCSRHSSSEVLEESSPNNFVERCRRDCVTKKDVFVCGKYKIVRFLNEVVRQKEINYGPFKVIRIPTTTTESILPEIPEPRDLRFGVGETLKFVRDVAEDLVTRRALVYTYEQPAGARALTSGPMILDEDEMVEMQRSPLGGDWRLFKKKKNLILPVLILLNLIKLKLLMLPILIGVHFIKKLIVIGGLFVPGILKHLKICKVPHHSHAHPFQAWGTAAEAPADYPTGYGQDDPGWMHRNDVLGYGGGYHGYGPYSAYYGGHRQRR